MPRGHRPPGGGCGRDVARLKGYQAGYNIDDLQEHQKKYE